MIKLFVFRQCPFSYSVNKGMKTLLKNTIRRLISIGLRVLPTSFYVNKLDKISKKYNNSDTGLYGNYSFPTPSNTFNKIYPLKTGQFCNVRVNLPNDWKGHLERRYGDYLVLPPEEQRVGHRPGILNFGPYRGEKNE